jgi:hypothetical protein
VIRFVNYVKRGSPRTWLLAKLCDGMQAQHMALLYYYGTSWFSLGKVLHKVFELKQETTIFLSDSNNNDDANLFYNEGFIQKLAYLVDISADYVI